MGEPLGEFSLTQQQESFGRLRVQELVEAFTPDFITGQVAMGASDQLNGYLGDAACTTLSQLHTPLSVGACSGSCSYSHNLCDC